MNNIERIKVASAAFALKHHRDLLAAAASHISREETSASEIAEALTDGLRRHAENAACTLSQRRWRKVVQLFVLLPVAPSIPPTSTCTTTTTTSGSISSHPTATPPRKEGSSNRRDGGEAERAGRREIGMEEMGGRGAVAAVSGVSTLVDLPLPNNGDYSRELFVAFRFISVLGRIFSGEGSLEVRRESLFCPHFACIRIKSMYRSKLFVTRVFFSFWCSIYIEIQVFFPGSWPS